MARIDREAKRIRLRRASGRFDALAVEALAHDMARELGEIADFSDGARALFATDASNYRHVPLGVISPRDTDDVLAAVEVCRRHHAPITPRGGGTALAGQTCNEAVIIDFSRWLIKVEEIDARAKMARVQPGCVLDDLRRAADKHGLTFGPDPATHSHNTLGGMIGNDSCGVHSVQAGRTSDNVERLDLVTYDGLRLQVGAANDNEMRSIVAAGGRRGQIFREMRALMQRYGDLIRERFPNIPRRVSGFANLDALLPERDFNVARALVGTEANCAIVLGATLKLVESPRQRALAIVRFEDVFAAADAVPDARDYEPLAIEGVDRGLIERMQKKHMHLQGLEAFEEGGGWLLIEFGGRTHEQAAERAWRLRNRYRSEHVRVVTDPGKQNQIWKIRESGLGATALVPGEADAFPGWEDSAVPPEHVGAYLRELSALMRRFGYDAAFYGHFGDGLVHCRIDFDLRTRKGVSRWREFLTAAADLVVSHGGSLSGEHGDGQARAALLEKMYGPELIECFARFKEIWDPDARLNPGKVVAPQRIDANLRLGPSHAPKQMPARLAFADDRGSFARATERCVGVGKCRRRDLDGEVMCPSYLATGEEKHSTRGRAHLLYEMARGEIVRDGWKSKEVEDALHLCLGCKGCRSDCPVNIDIASYKAEFRYHHYSRQLRPRQAYTLGMIHRWAPLMSAAPALANGALGTRLLGAAAKRIAGIAPDAPLPRFAKQNFRSRYRRHRIPDSERVVLWPDTFNNHFEPSALAAAQRVLAAEGYDVVVRGGGLCCGRALYDWGFLDVAARLWRKTIKTLSRELKRRTPIVVIEPACLSAFKHELPELLPDDEQAACLSRLAVGFAEFAGKRALPASGNANVLLQTHCHAHAMGNSDSEVELLEMLGATVERAGAGFCGMAGSFGLASDTRPVAMAIGEQGVLPKVRTAAAQTEIVASGFSCREQIQQAASGRVTHIAEFVAKRLVS